MEFSEISRRLRQLTRHILWLSVLLFPFALLSPTSPNSSWPPTRNTWLHKVAIRNTLSEKGTTHITTSQGIKLDDETRARLRALGKKRSRTPHWLMRTAIEQYLEHEEQYEREKSEDAARWEQYLLTGRAVEHSKVEPWLNDLAHNRPTRWPQ